MIVTKMKPLEDVLSYVSEHKRILVVGCDGCTTPPRGWKEAKNLAIIIEMAGKLKGKNFECKPTTVTLQCDNYICATTLRPQIEGVDAVLSLACGVGVQTLVEVFPNLQIYPAQDTIFVGSQERENASLYEKCRACGECILAETGGLCPVTRCAKGIMNGPCGGMVDGKCEVGGYVRDCAWYLIWKRLREFGRMDLFRKTRPPRMNSKLKSYPGELSQT